MGLAGAGLGAAQGLGLLQRLLLAQKAQQAEQDQGQAMLAQRAAELQQRGFDEHEGRKLQLKQIDLGEARRRDDNNQDGVRDMLTQRALMDEQEARNTPAPPKLRQVTTIGPKGRPLNRMVPETEAVEEYRAPTQGASAKPSYNTVIGPDGRMQRLTDDEIRAQGGVATDKGNAPDPSKAQDVLRRIVEVGTKLGASPGLGSLTGSRVMNPAYAMGLKDEPIAGTGAANAKAMFDTLKSVMTLENLGMLKGAMSDKDLLFLKSAGSSLETSMDDDAFKAELAEVIGKAQAALSGAPTPMTSRDGAAKPKFTILGVK